MAGKDSVPGMMMESGKEEAVAHLFAASCGCEQYWDFIVASVLKINLTKAVSKYIECQTVKTVMLVL